MKTSILGININSFSSIDEAYSLLNNYTKNNNRPSYITVNNVHTIVEGVLNKDYQEIINNAAIALPDGRPLSIVSKYKGNKGVRIFGPTFLEEVLNRGREDKLKHFFFGSSEETIKKMKSRILRKYPNAEIVGSMSPPFREFKAHENDAYLSIINKCKPDIVWVGLGAPKQERWMAENYYKLDKGVMIGIGAGFDYLAGNTKHAPKWMKEFALEWLYRLIQEPKRLWKRYLVTNTLFIIFVLLELTGLKKY